MIMKNWKTNIFELARKREKFQTALKNTVSILVETEYDLYI